jgi:hypothetical protein
MNRIAKHTRKQKIRGEETPSWKLAMALGTSTSQPWVKPESSLRSTNPFVRDQSHHILAFEISKLTLYRKITSLIQYLFLFEQVFSAFLIQSNYKTNSAIQKTYRTVNKTGSASSCSATSWFPPTSMEKHPQRKSFTHHRIGFRRLRKQIYGCDILNLNLTSVVSGHWGFKKS